MTSSFTSRVLNLTLMTFQLTLRLSRYILCESNERQEPEQVIHGYFCEFQVFKPTCGRDEVIVMETALYGRMKVGTCVQSDLGFVGCFKDVLGLLDRRCSGQRSCSVQVPDQQLTERGGGGDRNECMAELKVYLEVSYRCQKVVMVDESRTCPPERPFIVDGTEPGYLASSVTRQVRCGTPSSPWVIQVERGQTINISVVDFAWKVDNKDDWVYATIKDGGGRHTVTLASGSQRFRHVYTSQANSVEIRVMPLGTSDLANAQFLIHFAPVGCKDLEPPVGGWTQRVDADQMAVGCNRSGQSWTIRCHGSEWKAVTATFNCAGGDESIWPATMGAVQIGDVTIPHGLSIIIVALVAMFVGIAILTAGMIVVRRHYRRQNPDGISKIYRIPPTGERPRPRPLMGPPESGLESKLQADPDLTNNSLCEIDRDGYTHIWERPLPNPQPSAKKLTASESWISELEPHHPCRTSEESEFRIAGLGQDGYFGEQESPSSESLSDTKYYQLDAERSNVLLPT